LRDRSFPPPQLIPPQPCAKAELHPFSPIRRSPGEGGKTFPGIYLFALQKDKCLSSFKKFPEQKLLT
jgi:hypothetical protein